MINIAILGFGNIGSGVAELLEQSEVMICKEVQDRINLKYILDLRDFKGTPYEDKIVHDINIITSDPEVSIVCEMMGGLKPAFEYSLACLQSGKHVITSNKEVVANFGSLLCDAARDNKVRYLFEASVGGGIPVIRTIRTAYAGSQITAINGILNGTTNYILSQMAEKGEAFEDALREAQRRGYAEANPAADINGDDSCRKICILAALAFGTLVPTSAVSCTGISGVGYRDHEIAAKAGGAIKLIASASMQSDGELDIRVSPCFVPGTDQLSRVGDVYNAIRISAERVGDLLLYGQGAGKYPTAGAVLSDIIDVARRLGGNESCLEFSENVNGSIICDEASAKLNFFTAVSEAPGRVCGVFEDEKIIYSEEGLTAFIVNGIPSARFENTLKSSGLTVLSKFRTL